METPLTDKLLGNITEVNNIIQATALAGTGKLEIKTIKR